MDAHELKTDDASAGHSGGHTVKSGEITIPVRPGTVFGNPGWLVTIGGVVMCVGLAVGGRQPRTDATVGVEVVRKCGAVASDCVHEIVHVVAECRCVAVGSLGGGDGSVAAEGVVGVSGIREAVSGVVGVGFGSRAPRGGQLEN